MSKASETARLYAQAVADLASGAGAMTPPFVRPPLKAVVHPDGRLNVANILLQLEDALAFGRWLLDTFGEPQEKA